MGTSPAWAGHPTTNRLGVLFATQPPISPATAIPVPCAADPPWQRPPAPRSFCASRFCSCCPAGSGQGGPMSSGMEPKRDGGQTWRTVDYTGFQRRGRLLEGLARSPRTACPLSSPARLLSSGPLSVATACPTGQEGGGGSKKADKEPQEGGGTKGLAEPTVGRGIPGADSQPHSPSGRRNQSSRNPSCGQDRGEGGSTGTRSLTPPPATGLLCSHPLSTTQTLQHPQGSLPWNFPALELPSELCCRHSPAPRGSPDTSHRSPQRSLTLPRSHPFTTHLSPALSPHRPPSPPHP